MCQKSKSTKVSSQGGRGAIIVVVCELNLNLVSNFIRHQIVIVCVCAKNHINRKLAVKVGEERSLLWSSESGFDLHQTSDRDCVCLCQKSH